MHNSHIRIYNQTDTLNALVFQKMPSLSSTQEDEKDWYDKDLNDFDDLQSSDDDYTVQYQLIQSTQKLCSKNSPIIEHSYHGKDYPFDIWYLIAMHIAPEDVGRFALICRSSNQVVNTVPFWIALFRKYDIHSFYLKSNLLFV